MPVLRRSLRLGRWTATTVQKTTLKITLWAVTKGMWSAERIKVNVLEMKILRSLVGVTRIVIIRNAEVQVWWTDLPILWQYVATASLSLIFPTLCQACVVDTHPDSCLRAVGPYSLPLSYYCCEDSLWCSSCFR